MAWDGPEGGVVVDIQVVEPLTSQALVDGRDRLRRSEDVRSGRIEDDSVVRKAQHVGAPSLRVLERDRVVILFCHARQDDFTCLVPRKRPIPNLVGHRDHGILSADSLVDSPYRQLGIALGHRYATDRTVDATALKQGL